ncbi:gliding motility-associated C-terminal domain-containing protein [Pedobacter ghigonis]|uniref:gliding motility-associated C-terminal domain-containing protein n=1 Tax=Pedobacter ghigonis TaxID=2730403 RepID=UPI0015887EEE|nr:gliding motility-associated C-terminal domain-containing protein [Pedobacter ghigonis]
MRFLYLFLLISLGCFRLEAATFVVVNNANAGSGSLREAILRANANGTATADLIQFNIPAISAGDITITLTEELPALTSNIVIDATTQPTSLLESPSIKVKLVRGASPFFHGLVIDGIMNIEIYGIYFSNFISQAGIPADDRKAAVFLKNAAHVIIGAPNKQNGFGNNYTSVISPTQPFVQDDITISSNIIGLDPGGKSPAGNVVGIDLSYLKNSTIGGNTAAHGNLVSGNSNAISLGALAGNVNISFNVIGFDITKTKTFPQLQSTGIFANGENVNLIISDNYIASQLKGIKVDNVKQKYTIRRNVIGPGLNSENFGNTKYGIELYNCLAGVIGGVDVADQNVIAYNELGILVDASYPVSILKNSTYCNTLAAIAFKDIPPGKNITPSRITTITATSASGIYLPNALIELFYDDECPDCQGKTFIASIPTGADGTWEYNGTLTAAITSTGTNVDGATAAFSKSIISDANKIIKDAFCGNSTGSITQLDVSDASVFNWFDANNNLVGNERELKNVPGGTYYLKVGQPGGCESVSAVYTILNTNISYKAKAAEIKPLTCNENNGSVSITAYETQTPLAFSWADQTGTIVSNEEVLRDVAAGAYTLTASNGNGCTNVVGTFTVGIAPLSVIDFSKISSTISCDGKSVSISGVDVVGSTNPFTYSWTDANGNVAANTLNFQKLKPDKYQLWVKDKYGCEVKSEVIDLTKVEDRVLQVPNSISPNGDGVNDTWKINGAENHPEAEFSVFNRLGNRLFYSKGYAKEFNGTYNGKPLPAGVYYFVIDMKTDCGKISGSLTIIR